jgi:hypothetical protein
MTYEYVIDIIYAQGEEVLGRKYTAPCHEKAGIAEAELISRIAKGLTGDPMLIGDAEGNVHVFPRDKVFRASLRKISVDQELEKTNG